MSGHAMRPCFGSGLVVAVAILAASAVRPAGQPARLSVHDAVARYASGECAAAVGSLDTRRLTVAAFTRALDTWIATGGPASAPHRRIVAAAFALDAAWTATRTPFNAVTADHDPWGRKPPITPERDLVTSWMSQPLVALWAIQQLPSAGAPDATERLLWLAAVGFAEDGYAWHRLQSEILPIAQKRLPDEPRLRLAGILVRTNIDVGFLRSNTFPREDILRAEHLPSSVTGRIPQAIRELEPLLSDASLAGETELRIGYLELRCGTWAAALARFDAARSKASEPTLRAAADYFAGWVHEQQGHPDDAIAAYRRALAITPMMRNLATRLSALLFLRNERAEAYAILDPALNARPAPLDLLFAVERADARFVPDWLASIRRAIQ